MKWSKLANYCWMCSEALYLHKLIVHAFHEQTKVVHFYLVGWLLPVVTMIPYVIVHKKKQYDEKCWLESMGKQQIANRPSTLITTHGR